MFELFILGLELGVGEGIIIKAIAQATGRAPDKVKSDATLKGDLGFVAESSKGMQKTLPMFRLLLIKLNRTFKKIKGSVLINFEIFICVRLSTGQLF